MTGRFFNPVFWESGMDVNVLLEIVISLVALFWLVSMACSYIVEAINSLARNVRAEALQRFICEMVLGDGKAQALFKMARGKLAGDPTADPLGLLSHGLVEALHKPKWRAGGTNTPPSYVPASVFSQVLLDRLTTLAAAAGAGLGDCAALVDHLAGPGGVLPGPWKSRLATAGGAAATSSGLLLAVRRTVEAVQGQPLQTAVQELASLRAAVAAAVAAPTLPRADAALVLVDLLKRMEAALQTKAADPAHANHTVAQAYGGPEQAWLQLARCGGESALGLHAVDAARSLLDHAPLPRSLQEALRPILARANFDLAALSKGVEDWYDHTMERATGWFKRHTTLLLGICGVVVAAALNLNPLTIAGDLARDPALRHAGVAFAQQVVNDQGGSDLSQRYLFAQRAKQNKWSQAIEKLSTAGAADAKPASQVLDQLAREMQPLLFRSGQYVGLLPEVRKPAAGAWTADERPRFLKQVCVAWHESQVSQGRIGKEAKQPESVSACPTLAAHFGERDERAEASEATQATASTVVLESVEPARTASGAMRSSTTRTESVTTRSRKRTPAPESAASAAAGPQRNADIARFWSSDDVVWEPRLGAALWNALEAVQARPGAELPEQQAQALASALKTAQEQAEETARKLSAFIDRLPSAGWRIDLSKDNRAAWESLAWKVGLGIPGWLLMGLMVSFGAPFWFDLMSKLINRRVTGPRPADAS